MWLDCPRNRPSVYSYTRRYIVRTSTTGSVPLRGANDRFARYRAVVRSGGNVSTPEGFDSSVAAAVGVAVAAIDALDRLLVDQAAGLAKMIAQAQRDRTERQRHADALSLGPASADSATFDSNIGPFLEDLREQDAQWDERLARTRRHQIAMSALANDLRSQSATIRESADIDVVAIPLEDIRVRQGMDAARESERRRLAREIHDGPAQVLANALFIVGVSQQTIKRDPAAIPEYLATIRDLLRDGITEIRRFMFDLRPTLLEDQGLGPTLRYYVSEHERVFGTHVSLTIDERLPVLSGEQELCVFRVVQEALHNIRKHADVTVATVSLRRRGRWLALDIADAGRGFGVGQPNEGNRQGVGIQGMRERARLIGARFEIDSAVGEGTRVSLELPMDSASIAETADVDGLG